MVNLAGLYPPIPTPFDDQERIALAKLEANLQRWVRQPLAGVVMPGSNSEAAFLTEAERLEVWQVCAPILRSAGKRFIAGTGAETTAETIALTQRAAELGAVATLVLPPYFYKSALTHDALVAHYQAVADASPIPILLYNVPAFTGVDFALATFLTLAEHPQIVGVKDSSSNIVKMAELLAQRPDFQVFAGTGSALLPFLSIGAVGGIMGLANVAAEELRDVVVAFEHNQRDVARQRQLALAGLNSAVTARFGVAGLKYAMDQSGLYGGPTRRPLLPLGAAARAEIDRLLAAVRSTNGAKAGSQG
ncbi:MAG: dihydrodipicolinate synthase family protein [Chloroflexi bacterium]|nr:MAG: dihydrodipicolinate synthase family protein [Chloroflexota bacterium]